VKLRKLINLMIEGGPLPQRTGEWSMCEEGVIVEDDGGVEYRGQTGGVSCNHPVVIGRLYLCKIPKKIKGLYTGCSYPSMNEKQLASYLDRKGLPISINLSASEEAWVRAKIIPTGQAIVIVHNNSD
jgi:hypothetical protein